MKKLRSIGLAAGAVLVLSLLPGCGTSTGATALTGPGVHSCAIAASATVKCWGVNGSGQLGNGTTTNANSPVAVTGLTGATRLGGGPHHTCAVATGGAL